MTRIWYDEHRAANRFEPGLPAGAMLTYNISQPAETHFREAMCAEVECFHARAGWRTIVDTDTILGAKQANYIRLHSGRHHTWHPGQCRIDPSDETVCLGGQPDSSIVTFHFAPGQRCFATHRVPLDKPATFRRVPGDHRGIDRNAIYTFGGRHAADNWVDDFANNQLKIAEAVEKG